MEQLLKELASALTEAVQAEGDATISAREVENLWRELGSLYPLPIRSLPVEVDGEWGEAIVPGDAFMLSSWLEWTPRHLLECGYGPDQCPECAEAEKRIRFLTAEEFLAGLAAYYRRQAQQKAEQVVARNKLARALRSALANKD